MSVIDAISSRLGPRPTTALDQATVHELLANDRRRWLIDHLADLGESVTTRKLARGLAFLEVDGVETPRDITNADYRARYVPLYQTHLPRLEDEGVVTVDRDGEGRPTDVAHRLADISQEVRQLCGGTV